MDLILETAIFRDRKMKELEFILKSYIFQDDIKVKEADPKGSVSCVL